MKTPEEMAEEYIRYENESAYWTKHAFLAGYKAAMDQLADASKVMPDGPRFEGKTVPIFEPPKEEK